MHAKLGFKDIPAARSPGGSGGRAPEAARRWSAPARRKNVVGNALEKLAEASECATD